MHLNQPYQICAVDGGGTGCRVAIACRDGTVAARATGGSANVATDPEQAMRNVLDTVRRAAGALGLSAPALRGMVAHVGLAGVLDAADAAFVAARLPFARCVVTDDRATSLAGALGPDDGALLAIGTGSFIAIRRGGAARLLGGWGFALGDQASGAWLGRALLEQVLLAHDGLAAHSALTAAVLAQFDGAPSCIVAFARAAQPSDHAAFAPRIVEAAAAGDAVALALMARGAAYLNGALATAGLSAGEALCLTGGLGPHYAPLLAPEYRRAIRPALGAALDGALALAAATLHNGGPSA